MIAPTVLTKIRRNPERGECYVLTTGNSLEYQQENLEVGKEFKWGGENAFHIRLITRHPCGALEFEVM